MHRCVVDPASLLTLPVTRRVALWVPVSWSNYHRWCVTRILDITIRVEGTMPTSGVLVAARHESFFEAIDLPTLLDRPAVFTKAELMRLPVWGDLAREYGLVAVERDQGATALRRMLGAARKLSAAGRILAIFPEGTRIAHGRAAPLQSGFAGLYKLIGGRPVTEIVFELPSLRFETITAGRTKVLGFTACTPLTESETEVTQVFFWNISWAWLLKPILKPIARVFVGQDRRMVTLQREGLKHDPRLMLIRDADVPAMWYFRLKKEWAAARAENRTFVNPVSETTLRWRS
mgnify:CR=1 FL=1